MSVEKTMKMTFRCPKCGTHKTIEGKAGERKVLTCDNCNAKGRGSFPQPKRKGIGVTKKQLATALSALIIFVIFATFILIPAMSGGTHLLTVQSGSMEPDIKVGDVVVSTPVNPNDIKVGDVITYHYMGSDDPNQCFTHRVNKIIHTEDGNLLFQTKGDANEEADTRLVRSNEIIGKVSSVIPYLGYVGNFARSVYGYFTFIFIPAILIILFEVNRIFKVRDEGKTSKKTNM